MERGAFLLLIVGIFKAASRTCANAPFACTMSMMVVSQQPYDPDADPLGRQPPLSFTQLKIRFWRRAAAPDSLRFQVPGDLAEQH